MPGTTAAKRRVLVAGLLVAGACGALAGCGGPAANPYALPDYEPGRSGPTASGGSSARPDPTPTDRVATPSPEVSFTPADVLGQGAWAERGRSTARTPTERAVVRAVVRYLSVRVQLSNTWTVDEEALAAVASGQALTSARERAARQQERDRRSIGRFVVNTSSVQVDGDRARVTGCHFDGTSEVDGAGNIVDAPPGGILITMQLQRTGRTWRVLDWPTTAVPSCDWRRS